MLLILIRNIKIINAGKLNLQKYKGQIKTNLAVWFNKICKVHELTPKYVHTKVHVLKLIHAQYITLTDFIFTSVQ